jgi:hypothetical protein
MLPPPQPVHRSTLDDRMSATIKKCYREFSGTLAGECVVESPAGQELAQRLADTIAAKKGRAWK